MRKQASRLTACRPTTRRRSPSTWSSGPGIAGTERWGSREPRSVDEGRPFGRSSSASPALADEAEDVDRPDPVRVHHGAPHDKDPRQPVDTLAVGEAEEEQEQRHRVEDSPIAELRESPAAPHEVGEHDERDAQPEDHDEAAAGEDREEEERRG